MVRAWWLKTIGLAVSLRFVLSAFLFHADLKSVYHDTTLIGRYGWVEGYRAGIKEGAPLYYPPPVYVVFGGYQRFFGFLFSRDFWRWDESSSLNVGGYKGVYRDLLAMKIPLIMADLVVVWFLVRMVSPGRKKLAALVWLFNPFSLYAIYGTSHFDILPTVVVLASVWSFSKRRWLSYALLALGAGLKVFPLLLLPFWLVLDNRRWLVRLRDGMVFVGIFILSLAPIIRTSDVLRLVFLSNLTGGVTKASLDIGNHESLPVYLVLYSLLFLAALFGYWRKAPLAGLAVAVLGGLFGLSNFHPQWMLWIMPFLVVLVAGDFIRWQLGLLLMIAYYGVVLLIDDIYLTFGTLSPVNVAFGSLPTIGYVLERVGIGDQVQGAFHALFLAGVVWLVVDMLRAKRGNNDIKGIESVRLWQYLLLWGLALPGVVIGGHVLLSRMGIYIDSERLYQRESVPLTRETTIQQDFVVSHDNFLAMQVMMKNVGLKNKGDTYFNLVDQTTGAVLPFKINGRAIGDDYNLRLNFARIKDSAGHKFSLSISVLQAQVSSQEEGYMFVPYGGSSDGRGPFINGKNVPGSLSYSLYYNPGGVMENLGYTLSNVVSKI